MRFSSPFGVSVTRRGEKERRLSAFVGQHLDAPGAAEPQLGREICLIARSLDSPVARAVAAFAAEVVACGCSLRMILAQPDRDALARWAPAEAGVLDCEVRWARDPRLGEVHEQLVLGP